MDEVIRNFYEKMIRKYSQGGEWNILSTMANRLYERGEFELAELAYNHSQQIITERYGPIGTQYRAGSRSP